MTKNYTLLNIQISGNSDSDSDCPIVANFIFDSNLKSNIKLKLSPLNQFNNKITTIDLKLSKTQLNQFLNIYFPITELDEFLDFCFNNII